jgi:hypothetical protein
MPTIQSVEAVFLSSAEDCHSNEVEAGNILASWASDNRSE